MTSPLRSVLAEFGFEIDHVALTKGEEHVQGFIKTIEHVGSIIGEAFIVREVYEFVAGIVETSSALERMAIKTGIATDELQGLEYAANQTDISAESLDVALGKLGKSLFEAANGSKESAKAFQEAGIATKDAEGHVRTAADALPDIADAFTRITNPSQRAALAVKFFGKSGLELVPLLAKGSEGIRELTEEAKALGGGLSKDAIEGAGKLEEASKKLKFTLTGLKSQIAVAIMPTLAEFADGASKIVVRLLDWLKGTKLIQAATIGFGVKGVLALVKHLGGLTGILRVLGGILWRTIVPMLLLEDLFVFFAGGKSAIGEVLDKTFGKGSQQKVRDFVKMVVGKVEELFQKFKGFLPAGAGVKTLFAAFALLAGLKIGSFVAEAVKLATSLGPLTTAALALAAALGGIYAAWSQLNSLKNETEGLGLTGVVEQMAKRGTLNPFEAVNAYQNEQARKRAGLPEAPAPAGAPEKGTAPTSSGFGFIDKLREKYGPGAQIAQDLQRASAASPTGTVQAAAVAPAVATAPVSGTTVDSHNRITVGAPIVNVTVPAGTPAETTRAVGQAAGRGVKQAAIDLGAAQAALVTTGG